MPGVGKLSEQPHNTILTKLQHRHILLRHRHPLHYRILILRMLSPQANMQDKQAYNPYREIIM